MPATVNVRRSYADSRYGQLHVATAYPSGGGFDERTPLICLHMSGGSTRAFGALLPELGRERSVYAVDLPGHGNSDVATGNLTVADYAGAITDFANGLRLRTFDIFGIEAGALVAAELAIARGQQVRRVVFASVPYSSQPIKSISTRGESLLIDDDGSQIMEEWQRVVKQRGAKVSTPALQSQFADQLRAGAQAFALRAAMNEYPTAQRLPLVRQPSLVLCPADDLREQTLRAKSCLAHGSLTELPEFGNGILTAAPLKVAQLTRDFLDR
ncbi:MAG: alpha/beta hydrolase [Candidatus Obscuribacterales bacterium]|nr:alpha/beta hydrolase [Steroidobacteraceae bacterium]